MLNIHFVFLLASSALFTAAAPTSPVLAPSEYAPVPARLGFTSRDGLKLRYVIYPPTSVQARPIVIAPGCGESVYRYEALVADLRARGFGPIYVLEHRGQGYSQGSGVRADLVHVDHFRNYVVDFVDFMRGPVATDLAARGITARPDVIAHSMGGAIVNLVLRADPSLARRVVYVAPMMDINTSILNAMDDQVALWAAEALCAAGFGERLAVNGLGRARRMRIPGAPREVAEGIFRGGVTPGWLKESIVATRVIRRTAYKHAEPSLIVMAKRDRLVGNGALREYAKDAANCALLELDGPHGLHHDPSTRGPLVAAIDQFFGGCEDLLAR